MRKLICTALLLSVMPLTTLNAQEAPDQPEAMTLEQFQGGSSAQDPDAPDATQAQPTIIQPEQENTTVTPVPPKDLTFQYSPDYCEFEASFPEEPYIKTQCDGGESGTECYELVSYTQTFALDATVTLRVVCNQIGEDIKDKYNEAVMVKTLEAMTKKNIVQQFSTSYTEDENGQYRLAGLVGEGKVGMTPSIFIAQMWLGKQSAMTIEAELVGEQFNESDALFRDLLRGVQYKSAPDSDHANSNNEAQKAADPAEQPKND